MKKNISAWSAIGISLLCIMIAGCKCNKTEEAAWAKFLQHAKECSDRYDAFIADCNSKEAQARAELQSCRTNNCSFINTGPCGLDVGCWAREYNACTDACLQKYYDKLKAIEECKQNWNVVFWDCMNAKPK